MNEKGIIGCAYHFASDGMEEFMDGLAGDLEQVIRSYQGKITTLRFNPVYYEKLDLHGFVVTNGEDISQYTLDEFFHKTIEKKLRDIDELELEYMSEKEYEEYLEEKDNE